MVDIDVAKLEFIRTDTRSIVKVARVGLGFLLILSLLFLVEQQFIRHDFDRIQSTITRDKLVAEWESVRWCLAQIDAMAGIDIRGLVAEDAEAYLVQYGGIVVTPLRNWDDATRESVAIRTVAVDAAMAGIYGVGELPSYTGQQEMVAYGPVSIGSTVYALIIESPIVPLDSTEYPVVYLAAEIVSLICCGVAIMLLLLLETSFYRRNNAVYSQLATALVASPANLAKSRDSAIAVAAGRTNTCIIVFDLQGKIVWASSSVVALLGKQLPDIEGSDIASWLTQAGAVFVRRRLHRVAINSWKPTTLKLSVYTSDSKKSQELTFNIHRLVLGGQTYGSAATIIPYTLDEPILHRSAVTHANPQTRGALL